MHSEGPSREDIERFSRESAYCPHCGEEIHDEAGYCPECSEPLLDGASPRKLENEISHRWKLLLIIVLIIALLLLFL